MDYLRVAFTAHGPGLSMIPTIDLIHTYAHLDRVAKGAQGEFLAKLLGGSKHKKRPSQRKGA